MARIKIEIPRQFSFHTSIPIRITDINYGAHVGNDSVLSLIHEARVRFLLHHGFKELDLDGAGLLMSDVAIEFKAEIFYGDVIDISVGAGEFYRVGFDLYYRFEKEMDGKKTPVVIAKTGMVCYDYKTKKLVSVPQNVREKLSEEIITTNQ